MPDLPATVAAQDAKGSENSYTRAETEGSNGERNGKGTKDVGGDLGQSQPVKQLLIEIGCLPGKTLHPIQQYAWLDLHWTILDQRRYILYQIPSHASHRAYGHVRRSFCRATVAIAAWGIEDASVLHESFGRRNDTPQSSPTSREPGVVGEGNNSMVSVWRLATTLYPAYRGRHRASPRWTPLLLLGD